MPVIEIMTTEIEKMNNIDFSDDLVAMWEVLMLSDGAWTGVN